MSRRLQRFRLAVMKLHRRAGVAVVLFAIFLTVTGVMINHGNALGLDKKRLGSELWLGLYGVKLPASLAGYPVLKHWVSFAGDMLYFDEQPVTRCAAPLSGVIDNAEGVVALCGDGVVLLTGEGALIEKMPMMGVSRFGLAKQGETLYSRDAADGGSLFTLDTGSGEWQAATTPAEVLQWSQAQGLPASLQATMRLLNVPDDLTWERLLLDLHSGRIFGETGVLVVDFLGILLMSLALTGFWVAMTRKR